jgi:peptidoglycan/xylan/chitin deacetylase (PgdA/CDA1 family)
MTALLHHAGRPRERGRRPTPLVVRRRDIERDAPPAGAFRRVAYGRGLLPAALTRDLGTFCVDTTARVFSLTYDDGPDPRSTPSVLDTLARYDARATFFVLSEAARRHPGLVRRIVEEGHELALHGRDHRSLLTMGDDEAVATVRDARAAVEDVAGRRVRLYRPPYGEHTMRQARGVRRLGLELTIWSGDAFDWVDDAPQAVADRALAAVFPGAIVLLHDTRADPETLGPDERLPEFDRGDVLDRVLTVTRADGFTEVTTGHLLARHRAVKSLARERMARR